MDFFRRLFGGGGGGVPGSRGYKGKEPGALIFYVQPKGCDEVVRIRVSLNSELSQNDDYKGYFVQKTAMGTKCFQRAEITFSFDANKRLINTEVTNGEVVDEDTFINWQMSQA